MKRLLVETEANPQSKRSFNSSSRGESSRPSNPPTSYEGDGATASIVQNLTRDDSLNFVRQVRDTLHDQRDKYDRFLQVMKDFKSKRVAISGVIQRVKELFKGHPSLILGFNRFLHKDNQIILTDEDIALEPHTNTPELNDVLSFVNKLKIRGVSLYNSFVEILDLYRKDRKDITEVSQEVGALLVDHKDLLDEFSRYLTDPSPSASDPDASVGHNEERSSTVRPSQADKDMDVDRTAPEPHKEQNKHMERENVSIHRHSEKRNSAHEVEEIGVNSLAASDDRDALKRNSSKSLSISDEVEAGDGHNAKYWGMPSKDLDLLNCERCTPSYRLLPVDYPMYTASQRSELDDEVLNDRWVSVASGSENHWFKHKRQNLYEESLFKCDDDRFELDMLIEYCRSTAKRVEELLSSMNHNSITPDGPLRIDDHFSVLDVRCIERLYSDHGLDVMGIVRRNPSLALPVVLNRLKQKQEEWTLSGSRFGYVWVSAYARYHCKSLDRTIMI